MQRPALHPPRAQPRLLGRGDHPACCRCGATATGPAARSRRSPTSTSPTWTPASPRCRPWPTPCAIWPMLRRRRPPRLPDPGRPRRQRLSVAAFDQSRPLQGDDTAVSLPSDDPATGSRGNGRETRPYRKGLPMTDRTMDAAEGVEHTVDKNDRLVILASSVGTVFEWYDFYLYGSLAGVHHRPLLLGRERDHRLHLRPAGLRRGLRRAAVRRPGVRPARRPLGPQEHLPRHHAADGAVDLRGRPAAHLCDHRRRRADRSWSLHAPDPGPGAGRRVRRRGHLRRRARAARASAASTPAGSRPRRRSACSSAWSSSSACAPHVGEDAFKAWGWRIPFLVSIVLLGVSLWIRLKLNESPVVPEDEGRGHDAPRRR